MSTHIHVTKALLVAAVTQVGAFVVGLGIVNSATDAILITAATAVVNTAFLIANSIHALAHAKTAAAQIGLRQSA